MPIQIDGLKDTIVGCAELTIVEKSTNRTIVLPKPSAVSMPLNIEQRMIMTTDSLGKRTPSNSYEKGYNNQLVLTYGQLLPELLELRLGNKFKTVPNKLTTLTRGVYVTGNTVSGAPDTDTLGFGIAEDESLCIASVKNGNVSTALTRVPYDTFDATTTNRFAVGENLELKFSNNLIGKTVQVVCPYTITSSFEISADQLPRYEINAIFVDTANQAVIFKAFDAKVSLEGAGFNPEEENIQIPFFLFPVPGRQKPYELNYTNESVLVI
jgi:hypothetical protein